MVPDDVCAHRMHQPIKCLGGHPFEQAVGIPGAAHAKHNVHALGIAAQKLIHGIDILLQIRVNGDCAICIILGIQHAGQQRVLMAAVGGQGQETHACIPLAQSDQPIPRGIG